MNFIKSHKTILIQLEVDYHVSDYTEVVIGEKPSKKKLQKIFNEFIEETWERISNHD